MKRIASAILILLGLSAVAFGDGPMTVTDPESLGFSTTRLARIASWSVYGYDTQPKSSSIITIEAVGKKPGRDAWRSRMRF
jgi:hypothetical protein